MPQLFERIGARGISPRGSLATPPREERPIAERIIAIWQAIGWIVPAQRFADADKVTLDGLDVLVHANEGDQALGDWAWWQGAPFPLEKPTWSATGINGQPSIHYSSTVRRQILATPDFDATASGADCDAAIVFCVMQDAQATDAVIASFGDLAVEQSSMTFHINRGGADRVSSVVKGATFGATASATGQSSAAPAVITCTGDFGASPAATVRVDGVEQAATAGTLTGPFGDFPFVNGGITRTGGSAANDVDVAAEVWVMRPAGAPAAWPSAAIAATEALLAAYRGIWTPKVYDSLRYWAAPGTYDGGATLPDSSGNGFHATQSTAASRASVLPAALNGRDLWSFDGANDFFEMSAIADPVARDRTFVVVLNQVTGTGIAETLFSSTVNFGVRPRWASGGAFNYPSYFDPAQSYGSATAVLGPQWIVWSLKSTPQMWVNGVLQTWQSPPVWSPLPIAGSAAMGQRSSGGIPSGLGSQWMKSEIGEFMIFDEGLDADDVANDLAPYIASVWGL